MKYKFQVDKKNFEIEIPNTATFHSPTEIRVNRMKAEVWIGESDGNDVLSFFVNNRLHQYEVVRDEGGYPSGVYINDEYFPASLVKIDQLFYYREKPVATSKSGVVKSFIPGYIKKVFFSVDDRVAENEIVLIHEAMKMENEIRAPKSGVIKTLGVREGDNVLANHLLFEVE
jgi:biotin carboxyl carrier protein